MICQFVLRIVRMDQDNFGSLEVKAMVLTLLPTMEGRAHHPRRRLERHSFESFT